MASEWEEFSNFSDDQRLLCHDFATSEDRQNHLRFLFQIVDYERIFAQPAIILQRLITSASVNEGMSFSLQKSFSDCLFLEIKTFLIEKSKTLEVECSFILLDEIKSYFLTHLTKKVWNFKLVFLSMLQDLELPTLFDKLITSDFLFLFIRYLNNNLQIIQHLQFFLQIFDYEKNPKKQTCIQIFEPLINSPSLNFNPEQKKSLFENILMENPFTFQDIKEKLKNELLGYLRTFKENWMSIDLGLTSTTDITQLLNIKKNQKFFKKIFDDPSCEVYRNFHLISEIQRKILEKQELILSFKFQEISQIEEKNENPNLKEFDIIRLGVWSLFLPTFFRFKNWVDNLDRTKQQEILENLKFPKMESPSLSNSRSTKSIKSHQRSNSHGVISPTPKSHASPTPKRLSQKKNSQVKVISFFFLFSFSFFWIHFLIQTFFFWFLF